MGGFRENYRSVSLGQPVKLLVRKVQVKYKIGPAVDCQGELSRGQSFRDARELKQLLLREQSQMARNLVERFTTFATGAPVTFADRRDTEEILVRLAAEEYGLRSIVHEVIQSRMFQTK